MHLIKSNLQKLEKNILFGQEITKKAKKGVDLLNKESRRIHVDDPMSIINFEFLLDDMEDHLTSWESALTDARLAMTVLKTKCAVINQGPLEKAEKDKP